MRVPSLPKVEEPDFRQIPAVDKFAKGVIIRGPEGRDNSAPFILAMMDTSQDQMHKSSAINLTPIGYVERDEKGGGLSGDELRARPARIVLDPALADGLLGLEPGSDVVVLYYLHRATGYDLQVHPRGDPSRPLRGVFTTRSPRRPNPIAIPTVRLQRVEGNVLEVVGLDALDGSPVLDIKGYSAFYDAPYR